MDQVVAQALTLSEKLEKPRQRANRRDVYLNAEAVLTTSSIHPA